MQHNLDDTQRTDGGKIDEHNRREQGADLGGAARLEKEQEY